MREILFAVVLALLVGCADETPSTSTADETPSTSTADATPSTSTADATTKPSTEDFCSVLQELEDASNASIAAVFGQGFDAPVLTPAQVEEALDRLRGIQGRLSEAAPDDAPEALGRFLDIRSDYMDAVEENGYDPDPYTLDEEDPRVLAWRDESTRAIEEELGSYVEATCPTD